MRLGWILPLILGALAIGFALANTAAQEETELVEGYVQLIDPLDEPEYYCIDVPGFGNSLNLDGALTAHTCKLGNAEDELFIFNTPLVGNFYMDSYDLCMEAEVFQAGASLILDECSENESQVFVHTEDGKLQPSGDETLCIAVAPGEGEPTGGPSHLRRDLALQLCDETDSSLIEWEVGVQTPGQN